MANFNGTILTNAGRNLLAKALTGATLNFTKIQIGDGIWDESINPESLTALLSPKIDLPIQNISVEGDGTAKLRVVLTNTGLEQGFFTREIGIFAQDPDVGEILYAVTYADSPDFIPADGVTKVEDVFDIYTVVSNAQNVTAVISDTVVLATKQDIDAHNTDTTAHQDIRNDISNLQTNKAEKDLSNILDSTLLSKLLNVDGLGSGLDADLVRGLPADFTANFSQSGYQKLPSGLIVQWGGNILPPSAGPNTYTFPIAFPNQALMCFGGSNYDNSSDNYGRMVMISDISTSGFTARIKVDETNNWSQTYFSWIAIGY